MKQRRILTSIATLGLLAANTAALAADYHINPIVAPSPGTIDVVDMNNKGEVVGALNDPNLGPRAFLWRNGNYVDLHDAIDSAAVFTSLSAINNRSAIVGVRLTDGFRGFLFEQGNVTAVEVLPGEEAVFPTDINAPGQVIGETNAGGVSQAFIWQGGEVSILDPLPGALSAFPEAINDRGVAVGYSLFDEGREAVIWQNGSVMALGGLPEGTSSTADDINNREQILISSSIGPFVWQRGEYRLLGGLDGGLTTLGVADINNVGLVVGSARNPATGESVATLWRRGVAIDLNDLIASDDSLASYVTFVSAAKINDRGDIIVLGRDSRDPNFLHTYVLSKRN